MSTEPNALDKNTQEKKMKRSSTFAIEILVMLLLIGNNTLRATVPSAKSDKVYDCLFTIKSGTRTEEMRGFYVIVRDKCNDRYYVPPADCPYNYYLTFEPNSISVGSYSARLHRLSDWGNVTMTIHKKGDTAIGPVSETVDLDANPSISASIDGVDYTLSCGPR
jgi:hypothetical protein